MSKSDEYESPVEDLLHTTVEQILYVPSKREGSVFLPRRCRADPRGCVDLFMAIDVGVKQIRVYANEKLIDIYKKDDESWHSSKW